MVCRREADRRELIRFVWTEAEGLQVDTGQVLPGRGAYLCRDSYLRREGECWRKGGSMLLFSLTGKKKQDFELQDLLD